MRLYAISDIHLSYKHNREALDDLKPHPDDSLIICGDVGERLEHLQEAFEVTTKLFKQVFWVPGNHELYTLPGITTEDDLDKELRGEFKYQECLRVANEYGVITPEDDFRPADVTREQAVDWAMEENVYATDEALLHSDPYETRDAWCEQLVKKTEERLEAAAARGFPLVIINHWPLRQDLITIPSIPRFSIWCGTKQTDDWHTRFNAKVVVTGHLHVRRTDWIDGVRFEEVSMGYPRQWQAAKDRGLTMNDLLREILPGMENPGNGRTIWRRAGVPSESTPSASEST
ncbi:hypothetical protein HRR78_006678 [Exophiala dermatitidis]|nr:hypothetical protein HRR78_006678 [Exophiala dermatitidis]